MQLDLGEEKLVAGTAIQPRAKPTQMQYVTEYTVSYSLTGVEGEWTDVPGIFHGRELGITKNTFSAPVLARYVKIWPKTAVEHMSMRADALLCTPFIGNTPDANRTFSSVYMWPNYVSGEGLARSAIDSESCWSASVGQADYWIQFDLENPRLVAGTVLQKPGGSGVKLGQWVETYTVSYSLTGDEWTDIDGTFEIDETKRLTTAVFPAAVLARYVRMNPKSYHSHPAMRGDVMLVAGCVPIIAMTQIIAAMLHMFPETCMHLAEYLNMLVHKTANDSLSLFSLLRIAFLYYLFYFRGFQRRRRRGRHGCAGPECGVPRRGQVTRREDQNEQRQGYSHC